MKLKISFKKIKEDVNGELATEKDSCVSLSDFLDRKLHKNSLLPKAVQVLFFTICLAAEKIVKLERK